MPPLRIATFNLENFDDPGSASPTLAKRVAIMRPQLGRVNADVLCLQEVHSQGPAGNRTLAALDQLIAGTPYAGFHRATTLTTGGELYDERNLVFLSRFPIPAANVTIIRDSDGPRPSYQFATAVPPDTTSSPVQWERPILYARIPLPGGSTLHIANLHLKSKLAVSVAGQKVNTFTWRTASAWAEGSFVAAMKRVGQAVQVRMLVDQILDTHGNDAFIAVCGDFNADNDDVPVQCICGRVEDTGNPDHAARVLVACENNIPETSRYSLFHMGKGQMLDHVLVSRGLLRYFRHTEIHNEALPDESGAFRTDTKFPESDHAPVVAEFVLP
jgi:endonuclease/exonuclease/phosphatase family metal-dependent hydrolase